MYRPPITFVYVCVLALGLGGCSTRALQINSDSPARILDAQRGCELCTQTPCAVVVSRQTCTGYDSSSGFLLLRALLPDQRSATLVLETCAIASDTHINFEFSSASVVINEVGKQAQRIAITPKVEPVDEYREMAEASYTSCH